MRNEPQNKMDAKRCSPILLSMHMKSPKHTTTHECNKIQYLIHYVIMLQATARTS